MYSKRSARIPYPSEAAGPRVCEPPRRCVMATGGKRRAYHIVPSGPIATWSQPSPLSPIEE